MAEPRRGVRRPIPRRRCISRRSAFLLAYRQTGSIRAAADTANIAPAQHYHWFENDSAYRRDFEDVHELVVGGLQDEIVELAVHGRLEPVFYRGQQCGTIRRYSIAYS